MTDRISFALTIDVEPDDRTFDPAARPRWLGFEKLLPEMARFRTLLAKATGAAVHYTWLLRVDRQVERTYGRADWPLVRYRRELAELLAAGDEIGVHTHAWRWDDDFGEWVADHGNPAWVGRCIDESLATFRRTAGRRARVFSHGDRFLSNDVVRRLDRAGVACDVTLEPGRQAVRQLKAGECSTGSLPDLTRAPRVPYRPSPDDFLQPGVWRRRRLWMAPTTSAILPNPLTGSDEAECQPLMIGAPFSVMRQVFEHYLATSPLPVVVSIGRTDVMLDAFNGEQLRQLLHYLADHPRQDELIFETPPEAVRRYQRTLARRVCGRRDAARFVLSSRFPEPVEPAAPASVAESAACTVGADADPGLLRRELAAERGYSRTLAATAWMLRNRLALIEASRLWRWRRRWQQLRSLRGRGSARMGGGVLRHLLGLATRPGRQGLRQVAKLVFKKAYLWLEEEPVEIVPRRAAEEVLVAPTDPYQQWLAARAPRAADLADYRDRLADLTHRPKISVLMPVFNPRPEFLRAAVQSVLDQVYPDWELCIADDASTDPRVRTVIAEFARTDPRIAVVYRMRNGHISAASNSALALASGEFCALFDHDDLLAPDALYQMAVALNRQTHLDLLYSDEDKVDEAGRFCEPQFKPQWCPDTLLAGNYVSHLLTVRTELLRAVGGLREGFEGAQDFDLVLRLAEQTNRIHHVPRVLYHWRRHENSTAAAMCAKPYATAAGVRALEEALARRGEPGTVEPQTASAGYYCVRYALRRPGRVSLVIPTRDRPDRLKVCVRSLFEGTAYRDFEVLVVDNGSREPRTFELFRECAARYPGRFAVRRDDGAFNFSRLVNLGVGAVDGPYVLLLHNDIEICEPNWLAAMLEQVQRPSVGCVGARLLYPEGTVQHSGVVVGGNAAAVHAFQRAERDGRTYANRLQTVANYSAVSAACLLVRREVFAEVGGFDEDFPGDYSDIDFCLRVRRAGYQNLLVTHAELVHGQSATHGRPHTTADSSRGCDREIARLRERWPDYVACDPCISPHLEPRNGDLRIVA